MCHEAYLEPPREMPEKAALRSALGFRQPFDEHDAFCWVELTYQQYLHECACRELFESGVLSDPPGA